MRDESERRPVVADEAGDEREWADWWQGYWAAPADEPQPERPAVPHRWRESAHEFDFGGEE